MPKVDYLESPSPTTGGSTMPIKQGGIMLEFDDEDPQIQKDFQSALKQAGIS